MYLCVYVCSMYCSAPLVAGLCGGGVELLELGERLRIGRIAGPLHLLHLPPDASVVRVLDVDVVCARVW